MYVTLPLVACPVLCCASLCQLVSTSTAKMCEEYEQDTSFFFTICESMLLLTTKLIPMPPDLLDDRRDNMKRHCGVGQLSCAHIQSRVLRTFERDLACRSSVEQCLSCVRHSMLTSVLVVMSFVNSLLFSTQLHAQCIPGTLRQYMSGC